MTVTDSLQSTPLVQVLAADLLDLGETRLRQRSQLQEERADQRVRQSVGHMQTGLLGFDQAGAAQDLEVVRRIGDALANLRGQRVDGARPLRQEIEELEPARARRRLADPRDLLVDRGLEAGGCALHGDV
jgi:hypothetical protein